MNLINNYEIVLKNCFKIMDELNIKLPILSYYKQLDELDELYRSNKKSQNEIISSFVKIKPRKQTATIDVLNAAKILIKINSN